MICQCYVLNLFPSKLPKKFVIAGLNTGLRLGGNTDKGNKSSLMLYVSLKTRIFPSTKCLELHQHNHKSVNNCGGKKGTTLTVNVSQICPIQTLPQYADDNIMWVVLNFLYLLMQIICIQY